MGIVADMEYVIPSLILFNQLSAQPSISPLQLSLLTGKAWSSHSSTIQSSPPPSSTTLSQPQVPSASLFSCFAAGIGLLISCDFDWAGNRRSRSNASFLKCRCLLSSAQGTAENITLQGEGRRALMGCLLAAG